MKVATGIKAGGADFETVGVETDLLGAPPVEPGSPGRGVNPNTGSEPIRIS